MTPPAATSALVAAPIVAAEETTIAFGTKDELRCLYVQVDSRSRADVADFLAHWDRCCDTVGIDWRSIRRPQSGLVGLELRHCCGQSPAAIRLVFDVRRDAEAIDVLVDTEALVVGTRAYGRFANAMAAYSVDGRMVRSAANAADRALGKTAVAS